jgi:dynein heavy chain
MTACHTWWLQISEKWRFTEFVVTPYKDLKDTYILGGVDEVMMVLEDSMVAVATISSSRFVGGIR